jgi:hypothetical protein
LSSRKEITYFDEHSKVFAQGMTMIDIKDKMQLWGKISISQNGGQEILIGGNHWLYQQGRGLFKIKIVFGFNKIHKLLFVVEFLQDKIINFN